ncbi:hypothetical protein OAB57_03600, partial [Bacteriovoracaceae bacterium]|nr:hypothetical protein [Bacteriovoracaceae bacterium]
MNESAMNSGHVVVDGKRQIIEMLRAMSHDEKSNLIDKISKKNPQLAQEFREKSLSIHQMEGLPDNKLQLLISLVSSQ